MDKKNDKQLFIESIRVVNGDFLNLDAHLQRMNDTMLKFFKQTKPIASEELLLAKTLENLDSTCFKCRIIYGENIRSIAFEKYIRRKINSLQILEDNDIDYSYKFENRKNILSLLEKKGGCDDIIIAKNGFITDSSYSNLVFQNKQGLFTPSSFLLNGTKRQLLLKQSKIKETIISLNQLSLYDKVFLINAMIDIEDKVYVEVKDIRL